MSKKNLSFAKITDILLEKELGHWLYVKITTSTNVKQFDITTIWCWILLDPKLKGNKVSP